MTGKSEDAAGRHTDFPQEKPTFFEQSTRMFPNIVEKGAISGTFL
jgi:hypothetical protein